MADPTCATALANDKTEGDLTIASTDMICPAWEVTDQRDLWWNTTSVRGKDIIIPFTPGSKGRRRRFTGRPIKLPIVIIGESKPDGSNHTDPIKGLQENLSTLITAVATPTLTPLTLVSTRANGDTVTRDVIPEGFEPGEGLDTIIVGFLHYVLLAGQAITVDPGP